MLFIKTIIKADALRVIVISISLIIIVGGYLIHLNERRYPVDCDSSGKFSSVFNCMWLVIATITTVGYGELSSVSLMGRFISLFAAFLGLLFTAVMIEVITSSISLTDSEQ